MANQIIKARYKTKTDTEANWTKNNPVLLAGEMAISSDKDNKYKVGDGTSKWSALKYAKANLEKSDVTTALGYTPPSKDTTYSNMTAATSSAAGKAGLVPAPTAGKQTSFLRGDGTWAIPTNTTYNDATTTVHGLLSIAAKKALDILKNPIATCATSRDKVAKVATLNNFVLYAGATIVVIFTDTGTADPTSGDLSLNVNGTGAKNIIHCSNGYKYILNYTSGIHFCDNTRHIFTYDGQYWVCMDWDTNAIYYVFAESGADATKRIPGLVPPTPTSAGKTKFLREDATWASADDTIGTATSTKNGLMSKSDKAKLNGMELMTVTEFEALFK